MNILNYLNVAIGFSLVMLLLSLVTSFVAQSLLTITRREAHGERHALRNILVDIGFDGKDAKEQVSDLVLDRSFIGDTFKKFIEWNNLPEVIGNFLRHMIFLTAPEQHISREEFVLLLLRKAKPKEVEPEETTKELEANATPKKLAAKKAAMDREAKERDDKKKLAKKLFFKDVGEVKSELDKLEKAILTEETNSPTLNAQVWRSKAMSSGDDTAVSKLASKIFARYDEEIDRRAESVTLLGKFLGILITLPILLVYWPVDSMDLFKNLNKDPVVTAKFADIAETIPPSVQKLLKCQESNKNNPDGKQACEQEEQAQNKIFDDIKKQSEFADFFGEKVKKEIVCKIPILGIPIPFYSDCKRAELTPGIFVTWILVSLGSAFWLALLNKILGIRSEFSKKLGAQKDARETSQVLIDKNIYKS